MDTSNTVSDSEDLKNVLTSKLIFWIDIFYIIRIYTCPVSWRSPEVEAPEMRSSKREATSAAPALLAKTEEAESWRVAARAAWDANLDNIL